MAKTITHQENVAFWGTEDHLQAVQNRSFASMIYELISEKTPTESQAGIFELILNLSIDHGTDTPSAVATIEAAKAGKDMGEAVGLGISQINDSHGGAMEKAMEFMLKVKNEGLDIKHEVKQIMNNGERLAGFGHRIYKDVDPRAELIINQLENAGMGEEYIHIARGIESALEEIKGTKLVLNIDGAIAVALLAFGWDPKLGKAVFISSRAAGLTGQYLNHN